MSFVITLTGASKMVNPNCSSIELLPQISILVIFVMQTAKLIFEKKDAVEKKHLKSVMSLIIIVLAVLVNLSVYQNL